MRSQIRKQSDGVEVGFLELSASTFRKSFVAVIYVDKTNNETTSYVKRIESMPNSGTTYLADSV